MCSLGVHIEFRVYSQPPANKVWGKVIFLHLSVIYSVHGGGGALLSLAGGAILSSAPKMAEDCTPPPQRCADDGTAQDGRGRHPTYGQQAGSMHPTGMLSCKWNFLSYLLSSIDIQSKVRTFGWRVHHYTKTWVPEVDWSIIPALADYQLPTFQSWFYHGPNFTLSQSRKVN